jgi:pantoate--beta-alanine ligase
MLRLLEPQTLRKACDLARARGESVAFVPTMGALHSGHLSLIAEAKRHGAFVVASIFVNPTQFGPQEDFAKYPRTLEDDAAMLAGAGASALFSPTSEHMYVAGDATRIVVSQLTESLCGPFRPGHFEGVATVVCKLVSQVGPCTLLLGQKDYQQLAVVSRMVRDLFLPVTVVGVPTMREPDGLAMSSRNRYLSPEERTLAAAVPQALRAAEAAFKKGERQVGALRALSLAALGDTLKLQYLTFADADSLAPYADEAKLPERALLAVAGYLGKTRLIDNVVLQTNEASQ